MAEEDYGEQKPNRTSRISALIESENDVSPGIAINVCYSENNWETCEKVEIMIEDNTTVAELINTALYKLKNELFYENIDNKNFDLMLFKKKLQRPNTNYPKCNPESLVKDYAKSFFCLVENTEEKKEESNNKKPAEDKAMLSLETSEVNQNSDSKDINSGKNNVKKDNYEKEDSYLGCNKKCVACNIF